MLNHTYTSVKNANLVDCGKKQHIPSQPTPLLKENFLGEFRTELDKKKVLAALGIATELSLEWGNIKGNIGDSTQLMTELDARTKYISALDGMSKTIGEGIAYLESIVGGEEAAEAEQDRRISKVEKELKTLQGKVTEVQTYLTGTVGANIGELQKGLEGINKSIENITSLIKVSKKDGNALKLLTEENGEVNPGLYVQDLSEEVKKIPTLSGQIADISSSLDNYITRSELGTGPYKFVSESTFNAYTSTTSTTLADIDSE
jgi:archaellum component FlaC